MIETRGRDARRISCCPTRLTPAGRPRSTASPRPSGPRMSRFVPSIFPPESMPSFSAIGRRGSIWASGSPLAALLLGARPLVLAGRLGATRARASSLELAGRTGAGGGSPALALIVILSAVAIGPGGRPRLHTRWKNGVHQHTWGAGIAAMKANRM